ncbi:transmembrane protein 139 [Eleutherodactylus coqui]|uniref:Transmembrane protein 139 n=1 Tax=Eleutherodactylus coqui TaxID=57060 RepID=A0A8J6ELB0_ELECQ|nr:hypothetical protein GDO78_014561 [Eleutherodactylus coqui]
MASNQVWRGLHRAVITLGMAFMLIGVVLLTVSDRIFILGICFLAAGALAVLCFLLATLMSCFKKARRSEGEENPTETEVRRPVQRQNEVDPSQFAAPRYEDVIVYGTARVWTINLGPTPDTEPPPYISALEPERSGAIEDQGLPNPTLPRIRSDIHEIKASGLIPEQIMLEPLTPPPTYNESFPQWEEVFLPSQEQG